MSIHKNGVTRLTKKFQTTIPRPIRTIKGLEPGDKIEWILNDDGTVTMRKVVDDREVERFIGIIKTKKTTAEIMAELRGERNENSR